MTWAELRAFVAKRFAAADVSDPLRVVFPSIAEGRPILVELEVQRRLAPVATLRVPVATLDEVDDRPGLETEFGLLRLVGDKYMLARVLVLWSLTPTMLLKVLDQLAHESQRVRARSRRRISQRIIAA
jgi:hypothetical protein